MNKKSSYFKIASCVLLILGCIFIGIGFNKKNTYSNGDITSPENAYVGGDAYNYIINASYFAGYVTLGSISSLSAIILYSTATLIDSRTKLISAKEKNFSTKKTEDELPEI